MTVTRVKEHADSPTGGLGWKGADFERTFFVTVDDYADGTMVVSLAVDPTSGLAVPERGDKYTMGLDDPEAEDAEAHPYAICKSVKAKRVGLRHLTWVVTARYETIESSQHAMNVAQEVATFLDPLDEIADIKVKYEIFQKPVWSAYDPDTNEEDGKAITNSAGEIISPPFMRDHTRMCLTIARNEAATPEHVEEIFGLSYQYQNTINSDEFWGEGEHTAKINPFDIERISRSVGLTGELKVYLRVTYTIHFQWPDWDLRPLDNGPNYLDLDDTLRPFKAQGHAYRGLLDGDGLPLAGLTPTTEIPLPVTADLAPVFLDGDDGHPGPYQIYREMPFADLNLPINILGDME